MHIYNDNMYLLSIDQTQSCIMLFRDSIILAGVNNSHNLKILFHRASCTNVISTILCLKTLTSGFNSTALAYHLSADRHRLASLKARAAVVARALLVGESRAAFTNCSADSSKRRCDLRNIPLKTCSYIVVLSNNITR